MLVIHLLDKSPRPLRIRAPAHLVEKHGVLIAQSGGIHHTGDCVVLLTNTTDIGDRSTQQVGDLFHLRLR